ncbi:hypothetical protein I5K34_27605 [Pseudomonas aeruginosa]|nr:hypothetical protein [Pseudomonas aeruginosa]MBN5535624.1 hypothetical protein [Pseudomonas aeruginosa]HEJ5874566.1 hypothetical protein [Pseudomonas aeruginosa]
MAEFFDLLDGEDTQVSGGPIPGKKGWGKAPFSGNKAHHFELIYAGAIGPQGREKYWVALCGADAVTTDKAPMLSAGSWQRCKNCERRERNG